MNCPHCQKVLPEQLAEGRCPHCGGTVPPEAAPGPPVSLAPVKIRWLVFFCVLLTPPVMTLISAVLGKGQAGESASPAIGFFGGAAAGIACGVMLAFRFGRSISARVLLGLFCSAAMAVVCIMLSLFGCEAGGYHFDLR
jgi:hypothetical protein